MNTGSMRTDTIAYEPEMLQQYPGWGGAYDPREDMSSDKILQLIRWRTSRINGFDSLRGDDVFEVIDLAKRYLREGDWARVAGVHPDGSRTVIEWYDPEYAQGQRPHTVSILEQRRHSEY